MPRSRFRFSCGARRGGFSESAGARRGARPLLIEKCGPRLLLEGQPALVRELALLLARLLAQLQRLLLRAAHEARGVLRAAAGRVARALALLPALLLRLRGLGGLALAPAARTGAPPSGKRSPGPARGTREPRRAPLPAGRPGVLGLRHEEHGRAALVPAPRAAWHGRADTRKGSQAARAGRGAHPSCSSSSGAGSAARFFLALGSGTSSSAPDELEPSDSSPSVSMNLRKLRPGVSGRPARTLRLSMWP